MAGRVEPVICPTGPPDPEPDLSLATSRDANLKPTQRTAAWALACGDTRQEASRKAGVARTTISEWMKNPDFQAAIHDGTSLLLAFNAPAEAAARSIVAQNAPAAASELVDLVSSDDESMRFRAASKVLECVGIGGNRGAQVNVAVAVDASHNEAQVEAERILVERVQVRPDA